MLKRSAGGNATGGARGACPQRPTVREAYLKYAGWDPWTGWDQDRFDFDMVTKIEPELKALGGGVFLMDYPPQAASLAKLSKIDNFSASSERPSGGLSPCERGLSPERRGSVPRVTLGLKERRGSVPRETLGLKKASRWACGPNRLAGCVQRLVSCDSPYPSCSSSNGR